MPRRETLSQLSGGFLCILIAIPLNHYSSSLSSILIGVGATLIGQVIISTTQRIVEKRPKTIEVKLAAETKTRGESTPKFFRNEGPLFIDFEKDYFAEFRNLENIKDRLIKERRIMIYGSKGSGKSFLLRNLGFELLENGCEVYMIELKKESFKIRDIVDFFTEKQKSFLLIDDAHLDREFCEGILTENIKIRIALTCSHNPEDLELLENISQKTASLIEHGIEIDAKEIGERIITKYLKRKELPCDPEEKKRLLKYSNDLWILSITLATFYEGALSDEKGIYEKIERRISGELQAKSKIRNADEIILIIANFYKYGIPIEKEFVQEISRNRENWIGSILGRKTDLDKLIRLKEVLEYRGMLRIASSSMAELYFETIKNSSFLARNIKEKLNKNLEISLFRKYILYDPKNLLEIFICLGSHPYKKFKIMRKLVEGQKFINIITKRLRNERNIKTVAWFLFRIAKIDSSIGEKLLKSLKVTNLLQKSINSNDTTRFHLLLIAINNINRDEIKEIIKEIPENQIIKLYNNRKKIGFIEPALGILRSIDVNMAFRITSQLNRNLLVEYINSEENLGSIRPFLLSFRNTNKELFSWILKQIEISHLVEVINNSDKSGAIASFLGTINDMDRGMAREIYSKINKDHLVGTIFDSNKAGAVETLLFTIKHIDSDALGEIIRITKENLREKSTSYRINAQNLEGMVKSFSSLEPIMITSLFEQIGTVEIMRIIENSSAEEVMHLVKILNSIDPIIGHNFEEIFGKFELGTTNQV